jgi:hypothetical protein
MRINVSPSIVRMGIGKRSKVWLSGGKTVPEIAQPDIPVPIEQDVVGPQITMNDVSRVEISHCKDNINNNSCNSGFPSQLALKGAFRRRKTVSQ